MPFRRRRLLVAVLLLTPALLKAQGPAVRPEMRLTALLIPVWSADLGPGAEGNNRFEISRAYLTLAGRISERVTARLTTDAIREGDAELEIRLKYAFIGYTIPGSRVVARFGLTQTPVVEFEEALWEHRMQGSVPADRLRFLSSADAGLALDGAWGAGDQVQATVGVYNGEGWNRANTDAGKDLMARVTVRLAGSDEAGALGGLRLTGYGHFGSPAGGGRRQRALGMLSWRAQRFTVAGQLLATRDRSDADGSPGPVVDGRLVTAFAVVKVPETTVALIGRVERFDPDRGTAGNWQTRWTGGIGWRMSPELRILVSLEHQTYEGGAPTPALDAARVRALVHAALTL